MAATLDKQVWLIGLFEIDRHLTFPEIQSLWRSSYIYEGRELSRNTFHRLRGSVAKTFGIEIACRKSDNSYYLDRDKSFANKNRIVEWMASSSKIKEALHDAKSLGNRIQMEDVPGGNEYLHDIIEAMKAEREVSLEYYGFRSEERKEVRIKPYFLKVYQQRWYLIGPATSSKYRDEMRSFALDRFRKLSITDVPFSYPETFDPDTYYEDNFGIYHIEGEPQEVVLLANAEEAKYMDSLPLHRSQRVTKENADGSKVYALRLCFNERTYDFIHYLVARCDSLEVLSPGSLREMVIEVLSKGCRNYGI